MRRWARRWPLLCAMLLSLALAASARAGQYASSANPAGPEFDPFAHSIKNAPSYGIQSRLQVRALVIQEAGGQKLARVKTDLYIPQDLLWRRAAQILASRHIGIALGPAVADDGTPAGFPNS